MERVVVFIDSIFDMMFEAPWRYVLWVVVFIISALLTYAFLDLIADRAWEILTKPV